MTVLERGQSAEFLSPLVLKAQRGDRRAFDALYREHQPAIRSWCIRLLRSEPEGEQAAQEVFLQALRCLPAFHGDCPFKHWLQRIATNVCLNLLRTKKGADAAHGLSLDGMAASSPPLAVPGIEEGVVQSVFVRQIRSLVRACAKTAARPWDALDADIFCLLYEQGVETAREVAAHLGKSEDTVKYRIYHRINPVLASVQTRLQAEEETN